MRRLVHTSSIHAFESDPASEVIDESRALAEDMALAVEQGMAEAVCAASIFHYECAARLAEEDQDYEEEGNISFLKSGRSFKKIRPVNLPQAKALMRGRGLDGPVLEAAAAGKPLFGICVGLQLLFETSGEAPWARGLGVLNGTKRRLAPG